MEWKVADAKNKLSELPDRVDAVGTQEIRRREKVYVVTALDDRADSEVNRFAEIIMNGPSWEDLEIERIPGGMREVTRRLENEHGMESGRREEQVQ